MNQSEAQKALSTLSSEEFLDLLEKASPEQLQVMSALGQNARVNTAMLPRLLSTLLAAPGKHNNVLSILMWWEARRPAYNVVVGLCGGLTIAVMGLLFHVYGHHLLSGIVVYGIAANICYSIGAPAEMVAWLLWRDRATHVGPIFLSLGTIFSTALTLGIGLVMFAVWVAAQLFVHI